MSNKPNPNIISEEDFLQSLESGDVREIEKPPIDAGAPSAPPSLPHQTIQTLSGSLPASMQFPTDLIKTQLPGVPSQRLWPVAPAGTPGIASAVTSGTRGISVVANQANKTATSANTTAKIVSSTPVMQVDSGGSVVQAPVGSIGSGGGSLTPTLDNLVDGPTYSRVLSTSLHVNTFAPGALAAQTMAIDLGTVTSLINTSGLGSGSGWVQHGAIVQLSIPAGTNSLIFEIISTAQTGSGGTVQIGTSATEGLGLSIYSGSLPATPQANSNGVLTAGTKITVSTVGLSGTLNLALYFFLASGTFTGIAGNIGIHTVLSLSADAIT